MSPSLENGLMSSRLLLVTGATGLVGSHVCERAIRDGWSVRALVRSGSDREFLKSLGVELVEGDLARPDSLPAAVQGVTHVVHCAAKVGDWGPVEEYIEANVGGLERLLDALAGNGLPVHFVQISSLGVYPAGDQRHTDESTPISLSGIDGYTLSKARSEEALRRRIDGKQLTAIMLRPGFIYGPRDRTVLPRLTERIRSGKFAFMGSGEQLMNNTFVGNLVDAVFLALDRPDLSGEAFNITDGRLVSKKEFVETVCRASGLTLPTRHVPLGVAKALASVLETVWRTLGKTTSPPVSRAAVKFMGYSLDFSIEKAKRVLEYRPAVDFKQAIELSLGGAASSGIGRSDVQTVLDAPPRH
jgi:nucleoside-diphosphate-sugar epimerase